MAKKKKKTRKELLKEPDEFMTFTGKAIRFVSAHQQAISYGLSALIALVLIFFGYQFFAQRAEKKAFLMLEQTLVKYDAAKKATSAAEAFSSVSEEFQRIVDKYGGNAGGKLARVSYANISYDAGQYQKAIELYEQSLNDFKENELIYNLILSDLGYAYQHIADDRKAVEYFEKAAAAKNSSLGDEALFNLGLLYEKIGDDQKRNQAFQQILRNYPDSIYFNIVEEKLSAQRLNSPS